MSTDKERNGHMSAAILYGVEDLKIETVDIPEIKEDEVLVRVKVALTCGTDLKVWKRGYNARMIKPPALLGHELAGVIEETGSRVNGGVRKGMRVFPANSAPCTVCFYCKKGQPNLCEDLLFNNGAYAEYIRIPGRIVRQNMLEIPDGVTYADAAMTEPLACVLRGIHETGIKAGDTAVVIGCGAIGLKFIRILAQRKVRVIAIGKGQSQMNIAKRLGATAAFDVAQTENPVAAGRQLTEEWAGAEAGLEGGVRCGPDGKSGGGGAPIDRRRARGGRGDRSGRARANLGMGAANRAQGRHGESVRRLPVGNRSENRSSGAALRRDHHQVHFSSHAAIHSRSAGNNRARGNPRQRFCDGRGESGRIAEAVSGHEKPKRRIEDRGHSLKRHAAGHAGHHAANT